MLQPATVATPATAVLGFGVQVRVAPAGVVMARVTAAVLVVVLPPASWTVTTCCVPNALPPVDCGAGGEGEFRGWSGCNGEAGTHGGAQSAGGRGQRVGARLVDAAAGKAGHA